MKRKEFSNWKEKIVGVEEEPTRIVCPNERYRKGITFILDSSMTTVFVEKVMGWTIDHHSVDNKQLVYLFSMIFTYLSGLSSI